MKKVIGSCLLLFLLSTIFYTSTARAVKIWGAIALTGGGSGALDAIDGNSLTAGDVAMTVVTATSIAYWYIVIDDSAAENSPSVIRPDTNPGSHSWHLVSLQAAGYTSTSSTTPTLLFCDIDAPGTDKEIVKLIGAYIDGADGAENGALTLYAHEAGTSTAYLELDGKNIRIEFKKPVLCESTLIVPIWEDSATMATGGLLGLSRNHDALSVYDTDGGEVTGEVNISTITHRVWTFDPKAICDGTIDRLFLMTIGDEAPHGIIIDEWKLSFEADPTTELDLDLKRADAYIGVANAAVVDVLDTTAGVSSEDTDANINAGAAVANTKVLYLEFGTAYTETGHQVIFELWYHTEED